MDENAGFDREFLEYLEENYLKHFEKERVLQQTPESKPIDWDSELERLVADGE